jgi:hypothetical protein
LGDTCVVKAGGVAHADKGFGGLGLGGLLVWIKAIALSICPPSKWSPALSALSMD